MNKQSNRIVPKFATEAEEADWWYRNSEVHGKELLEAVRSGEAQILTKEELLARIEASKKKPAPVVALRIPAAGFGSGSKTGGTGGAAVPDLHQIAAARDAHRARRR